MNDFLLITKYSIMVLAGLFALAAVFVSLALWVDSNTQDLDAMK